MLSSESDFHKVSQSEDSIDEYSNLPGKSDEEKTNS